MNKERKTVLTISISFKKPSIRIYKDVIHLIGDPHYILLLVNPEDYSLAVLPSERSDSKAHYIGKYMIKNAKSVELYSTALVRQLKSLLPSCYDDSTCKMCGKFIVNQNLVKFHMKEAVLLNKE